MEEQKLKDQNLFPDLEVIKENLTTNQFNVYSKFLSKVEELNLVIEWRYYNDGKAWLGKILNKKKNMGWLSIWDTGFKVTVFFTEKTIDGFRALDVNENMKKALDNNKPVGKLIALLTLVESEEILNDLIKVLEYKMSLK